MFVRSAGSAPNSSAIYISFKRSTEFTGAYELIEVLTLVVRRTKISRGEGEEFQTYQMIVIFENPPKEIILYFYKTKIFLPRATIPFIYFFKLYFKHDIPSGSSLLLQIVHYRRKRHQKVCFDGLVRLLTSSLQIYMQISLT